MYLSNTAFAKELFSRRLTLQSYLKDRDVEFNTQTNSFWLEPRLSWAEVRELFGGRVGGSYPSDAFVTDVDHFLVANGKMVAPTWSITPGPPGFGGSCLASTAGFHLREVGYLRKGSFVRRRIGEPTVPISDDWICNDCYAMKGRYPFIPKIVKNIALDMWMERVSDFADSMIDIVANNYDQLMRPYRQGRMARSLGTHTSWPHPSYLRIHDAGDFFSPEYFEGWCEVAAALPKMKFWANTRIWALPRMVSAVSHIVIPSNFTVRASELYRNVPPANHAWPPAAATAVATEDALEEASFDGLLCPAVVLPGATCQNSGRRAHYPRPQRHLPWAAGCRACWDAPELPIIYGRH